jgi:hypothetical protein
MSSYYNIKMSLDDTLEIDYLIEDQATSGIVSVDRSDHHSNRFRTNTYVFDPQGTGEYTITVNGQKLNINVTDSSQIPSRLIDDFEDGDISEYSADTSNFGVQTSTVFEGTYTLRGDRSGGSVNSINKWS